MSTDYRFTCRQCKASTSRTETYNGRLLSQLLKTWNANKDLICSVIELGLELCYEELEWGFIKYLYDHRECSRVLIVNDCGELFDENMDKVKENEIK